MTLSDTDIQLQFREIPPFVFLLLLEVREQMLHFLPPHQEHLRWNALAFDKPGAKATVKDNICYLRPRNRTLEIGFGLGVFLRDPGKLLQGNGRYKRFIPLKSMHDYQHQPIRELVLQSYDFDGSRVLYKLLPNDDYQALRRGI